MAFQAPQPLQTIGCQDLLTEEYTHCGWLRKRHFTSKLKLFRWPQVYVVLSNGCFYYFRTEYSDSPSGRFSLYGYNGVHRAEEIPDGENKWGFKIVHTHKEFKTYYFAASSEKEMKKWMRMIKAELVAANGQKGRDENYYYTYRFGASGGLEPMEDKEDDKTSLTYQDIEKDIYDDMSKFRRPKDYEKEHRIKRNDDASDDEDIPDDPRESKISNTSTRSSGYGTSDERPPMALPTNVNVPPPIPARPGRAIPDDKREKKVKKKKKTSKTEDKVAPSLQSALVAPSLQSALVEEMAEKLAISDQQERLKKKSKDRKQESRPPLPEPEPRLDPIKERSPEPEEEEMPEEVSDEQYWDSIYLRNATNEQGNEIIRGIAEDGVYLIREGGTGGQVLVVFANNMPKKYKVQNEEGKYFIGRDGPHCDTLEELLYEFYQRDLPTVNVRLTTPYKLHPKYMSMSRNT